MLFVLAVEELSCVQMKYVYGLKFPEPNWNLINYYSTVIKEAMPPTPKNIFNEKKSFSCQLHDTAYFH